MRLNRYLASCGLGSRRGCETLITEGRVTIDGVVCTELSRKVEGTESISVNGKHTQPKRTRTIVLHKPTGHITSRSDPHGRPTVYDLLPPNGIELAHIGRLDFDSEGLLLLTNDGALADKIAHPSKGVEKEYHVTVDKAFDPAHLDKMVEGIEIEGGSAKIESGTRLSARRLQLVLKQGLKRQIRLMLEVLGYRVKRLVRARIGPLELEGLNLGRWRELSTQEIKSLTDAAAGRGKKRHSGPRSPGEKPTRKPRFPRKEARKRKGDEKGGGERKSSNADRHDEDRRGRRKPRQNRRK